MKICKKCEKKFGMLEKIFYTEDGEMYCTSCVRRKRDEKKKLDGEYVELSETKVQSQPQSPPQSQPQHQSQPQPQTIEPQEYAHVSIPADPPVPVAPSSSSSTVGGWEFKVVKISPEQNDVARSNVTIEKFEKVINRMGDDGWELVSVIPLNVLLMKSGAREEPAMIFKRIKKDSFNVGY